MALPKLTLYEKHGKGPESAHHFARIMDQLLFAEESEKGRLPKATNDNAGDYKSVDFISKIRLPYRDFYHYKGFQYKYFPSPLKAHHKTEIKRSLKKALQKFPELNEWCLVTPENFNRHDQAWFEALEKEFENTAATQASQNKSLLPFSKQPTFLTHMGHTAIMYLMLRHQNIAEHYYEELFPNSKGKLILSKVTVDTKKTNWFRNPQNLYVFTYRAIRDKLKCTNNLVFDFQFINNTKLIHHLEQVNVVIEKTWYAIKGAPFEDILKSSGRLSVKLDYNKKTNEFVLDELLGGPVIFRPDDSKRFQMHIKNIKDCPGNMMQLRFEFIFDRKTLKTGSYLLDF